MHKTDLYDIILANLKHAYFNAVTDDIALKNGVIPSKNHALPILKNKADDIMKAIDEYHMKGKDHEHNLDASPCEEGCECNYIHLTCQDKDCNYYGMAQGWDGCNVDWKFWIIEEPEHLKRRAKGEKDE